MHGATEEMKFRLKSWPIWGVYSSYDEAGCFRISFSPFRGKNDQRLATESSIQARKWLSSLRKLHSIV